MNDVAVVDKNPISNNAVPSQVGSLNKEVPVGANSSEFIKPVGSEVNPNISPEMSESGIKTDSNKPDLTSEHKELGIKYAGPTIPTPTSFSDNVQLPEMSKAGSASDSGTWFNWLLKKIMAWKAINK